MKDWMAGYMIKFRRINRILISVAVCAAAGVTGLILRGASNSAADEIKLEIISMRMMSEEEAVQACPDCFGHDVAVRLRLSTAKSGVYFYASRPVLKPVGYTIKITDHGPNWLFGKELPSSPGIQGISKMIGDYAAWYVLPGRGAVEWEVTDTTGYAGQKHAFTVFIKNDDKDTPRELISDSYVVPAAQ